jgi:choline-sulfatase
LADFLLEDAIDWLQENLGPLPNPFMGYFHFYPPHSPYRTHRDFYNRFRGEKIPVQKPIDMFGKSDFYQVNKLRTEYDEFILYVDREFGRLIDYLDKSGLLDNTWVILTSDHGELFERGIIGHVTPVLYEPLIRVPLMIFEPSRTKRLDVHQTTSAVDILPTLLHVTGQEQVVWTEGNILPPFSGKESSSERSVYALEAKKNGTNDSLTTATIALMKDQYKLMYFFGYEELGGEERIELYDLKNDPEELNNLSLAKRETTAELLNELKQKLAEVNEPYL